MATVIILVFGCFCVCFVCCAHMLPVGGVVDPFSGCLATSTPAADQVDWQPFSAADTSSAASDCLVHASANSNAHRLWDSLFPRAPGLPTICLCFAHHSLHPADSEARVGFLCCINQPKQEVAHWNIELSSWSFHQHLGLSPSSESAAACVSTSTASSVFLILALSVSAVLCEPRVPIFKYYFILKEIGKGCRWKSCTSFQQLWYVHGRAQVGILSPSSGWWGINQASSSARVCHWSQIMPIQDSRTALVMHLPETSSM